MPSSADLVLEEDNYYSIDNPSDTDKLANLVEVTTQPLVPADAAEEVYVQQEAVQINIGASSDPFTTKYSDPPVTDGSAKAYIANASGGLDRTGPTITNTEIAIVAADYYAWGAVVTVLNNSGSSGSFLIVVTGTPLTVQGSEVVITEDANSQVEFGELRFAYEDNPLVQTRELAGAMGALLLDSYKQPRKDVKIEWRGNPALEISDVTDQPEFVDDSINMRARSRVFRNKIQYDGTLRGTIEARKLYEYEVSTLIQGTNDTADTKRQQTNELTDARNQGITAKV